MNKFLISALALAPLSTSALAAEAPASSSTSGDTTTSAEAGTAGSTSGTSLATSTGVLGGVSTATAVGVGTWSQQQPSLLAVAAVAAATAVLLVPQALQEQLAPPALLVKSTCQVYIELNHPVHARSLILMRFFTSVPTMIRSLSFLAAFCRLALQGCMFSPGQYLIPVRLALKAHQKAVG